MSKSDRISAQLDQLETHYRVVLVKALEDCARGRWGLFGQNEHLGIYDAVAGQEELRYLAEAINRLRTRLGDVPFPLHEEFEQARGYEGANAPGEPKLAKVWLDKLASR